MAVASARCFYSASRRGVNQGRPESEPPLTPALSPSAGERGKSPPVHVQAGSLPLPRRGGEGWGEGVGGGTDEMCPRQFALWRSADFSTCPFWRLRVAKPRALAGCEACPSQPPDIIGAAGLGALCGSRNALEEVSTRPEGYPKGIRRVSEGYPKGILGREGANCARLQLDAGRSTVLQKQRDGRAP